MLIGIFFHSHKQNKIDMKQILLYCSFLILALAMSLYFDYLWHDSVKDEFCCQINALHLNAKLLHSNRNVYMCFAVTGDDIKNVLESNCNHCKNWSNWAKYDKTLILDNTKYGVIGGTNIWCSYKSGSDEYNQVSIYADKDKNIIYFCRLLTYGR